MISLGIESTAHTFGVGIADSEGNIFANEKDVYQPRPGSGIVPREAADHHSNIAVQVYQRALKKSGLSEKDIDLISFSSGPGLPPCLSVGAVVARTLSYKLGKPLIPVNHAVSHIEIGRLKTDAKNPIMLYVSGGNTQVLGYESGRYRCFGETLDIPIGNALDYFARSVGLGYPGGPEVEKLAKKGKYIELPYTVKGMDLSFSGITTEAIRKAEKHRIEDVCLSFQETCFAMLAEVLERALAHTGKDEIILSGGVAQNSRLQDMLKTMAEDRGAKFHVVPAEYAGDCGAMIAWTGLLGYRYTKPDKPENIKTNASWRTDQVDIPWFRI